MAEAPSYLTARQDTVTPTKTALEVPELGKLKGWVWPNGVRQFFSVPYGAISKNWTRATLADSWPNGDHDGTKLGACSMQPAPYELVAIHDSTPVRPYSYLNKPTEDKGKECLTINITIPPSRRNRPVPIINFIHRRSFMYGSSVMPIYDGYRLVSELIRKGQPVVYTSSTYRPGLLGLLASADIARDLKNDGLHGNGNFGLTDQQLGLEWIQKPMGKFGGDINNVTLVGESAGSWSISGTISGLQLYTKDQHEILYERSLSHLASPLSPPPSWLRSYICGELRDEGMIWRDEINKESLESLNQLLLKHLTPKAAAEVKNLYGLHPGLSHEAKNDMMEDLAADLYMRMGSYQTAISCLSSETPVRPFFYHFDQCCTFPNNIYRKEDFHAMDLLYLFLTRYEDMNTEE